MRWEQEASERGDSLDVLEHGPGLCSVCAVCSPDIVEGNPSVMLREPSAQTETETTQIVVLNLGQETLEAPFVVKTDLAPLVVHRAFSAKSELQPAEHQRSETYTENEH
jgi:hypothetical protein